MRNRLLALIVLVGAVVLVPSAAGGAVVEGKPDVVGVVDPATGTWYLREHIGTTTSFVFGDPGDVPLTGDWDGDGIDGVAAYRADDGRLLLRDDITVPISVARAMHPGAVVTAGDFNGDGTDEIAYSVAGRLHLGVSGPDGGDPLPILIGGGVDSLASGDFDGDGRDEIAAERDGHLEAIVGTNGVRLDLGQALPVAGDWDGDGIDTLGGYHPWTAQFTLYHGIAGNPWPAYVAYGSTGMLPVAGDFGDLGGDDPAPPRVLGLPAMEFDEVGPHVALLQEALADLGMYRGPIDGEYGWTTAFGVMTLHKVLDLERTWEFQEGDWRYLADFRLPELPDRPDEPHRLEVDIGRQVIFLYEEGVVSQIVPTSTGGTYAYYSPRNDAVVWAGTPRGDFTLFHFSPGWHCDSLTGWCIYNPWSFTPHYAVHGYPSVPEYPASHGCVRLTTWDSDALISYMEVGMPIHIWDVYDPDAEEDPAEEAASNA
jgi:hypothetical protein